MIPLPRRSGSKFYSIFWTAVVLALILFIYSLSGGNRNIVKELGELKSPVKDSGLSVRDYLSEVEVRGSKNEIIVLSKSGHIEMRLRSELVRKEGQAVSADRLRGEIYLRKDETVEIEATKARYEMKEEQGILQGNLYVKIKGTGDTIKADSVRIDPDNGLLSFDRADVTNPNYRLTAREVSYDIISRKLSADGGVFLVMSEGSDSRMLTEGGFLR